MIDNASTLPWISQELIGFGGWLDSGAGGGIRTRGALVISPDISPATSHFFHYEQNYLRIWNHESGALHAFGAHVAFF